MVGSVINITVGAVIVGVAVTEAQSVAMLPLVPHTLGVGGTLIGAGITTGIIGAKLLWEGFTEDDNPDPCP